MSKRKLTEMDKKFLRRTNKTVTMEISNTKKRLKALNKMKSKLNKLDFA